MAMKKATTSDCVSISPARQAAASSALYEITLISIDLRDRIAMSDDGELHYLARGQLARVQELSETISECIGDCVGRNMTDDELSFVVECRGRHQEAANG